MSGVKEDKKGPTPPPQEEEEEVPQAVAQAKREAMPLQDETSVLPWTGYGCFSMVMG